MTYQAFLLTFICYVGITWLFIWLLFRFFKTNGGLFKGVLKFILIWLIAGQMSNFYDLFYALLYSIGIIESYGKDTHRLIMGGICLSSIFALYLIHHSYIKRTKRLIIIHPQLKEEKL